MPRVLLISKVENIPTYISNQAMLQASDVNGNIFLTYGNDNEDDATVGIAYVGSVCADEKAFRSSVSEWLISDLVTAEVTYRSVANLEL